MAADRQTGDFGRKLRDARERRGVPLRQIANTTKISVSVLEALERNDISRLPGGIFSRAFVRSYAVEIGLDPEETIQEFIAQFPHDSVTAGHPTSEQVEDTVAHEADRRMATTFVRLIAVSVPIAAVVLYFGIAGRRAEVSLATPVAVNAVQTGVPSAPAAAPASAPADVGLAAAADAPDPVADHVAVVLAAKRPCWISATVDGQKVVERTLQAGEQQTFDVRRELVLTAGDAGGLSMTLNGAPAKALGDSGRTATARVTLANFKDYLLTQ
jgi:cytoskeleton protein RodZ